MLEFSLSISRNGSDYYSVDLFSDQKLDYSLDFYDALEVDKIKMPFYTDVKIPLTATNMGSNRFNFNPSYSAGQDFPRDDFFFRLDIFAQSKRTIAGVLNVRAIEYNSNEPYISVELKDQLAYYLTKVKEVSMAELYTDAKYTNRETLFTFTTEFNDVGQGGQEGRINIAPDSDEAIIFPYVDMNNDTEKYGYPQRAFLEYGTGINRTHLIPAFSVQKFLEYVGDYLSTTGFPVRVDSSLFAVGDFANNPHDANFEPENLRFINDAHMLAKQDVNRRTFDLQQAMAWVGTNYGLEYLNGTEASTKYNTGNTSDIDEKWFGTRYWGNVEIHGNAGGVSSTQWKQRDWGVRKQMTSYPATTSQSQRGWFCPKVSFNADLSLGGNYSVTIGSGLLRAEIPVVDEDKMVTNLDHANAASDIEFGLFVGIYEDGGMVKKIRLQNAGGQPAVLTPSGAITGAGANKTDENGEAHFYDEDGDIVLWVDNASSAGATDTLLFTGSTFYFPTDETIFVNGGSRYSTNYFLEPVSGSIRTTYVSEFTGSNPAVASATQTANISHERLKKIITRIPLLSAATGLNVRFNANEDFLPHNSSDEIVIKDSIEQTTEDTIYSVLLRIAKRFNCGLFYEYDANDAVNVLRIDPIQIMRSGSQNIDTLVDDTKSVKVTRGSGRVKNLSLNNKDYDRFFDANGDKVMGSTSQILNSEGTEEVKIDLDSSVFYKSVCDIESFERPQNLTSGAFTENELGLAKNIFSKNDEVGFRFAYVKAPKYRTWLLHPFIAYNSDQTLSGTMKTETERIYLRSGLGYGELSGVQMTMNGELTHVNGSGFDLRAEDENGNTTDYYALYSASDSLRLASRSLIEFSMVVHTYDLGSLDFFMQTFTAPTITPNNILVKSVEGEVYDNYAYLTITGLIE